MIIWSCMITKVHIIYGMRDQSFEKVFNKFHCNSCGKITWKLFKLLNFERNFFVNITRIVSGEAHYSLVHGRCKRILPGNDFIHYRLLLAGCATEIDAGGLDALVAHKVS